MAADRLNRFMLRDAPVRGEIVSIDDSWREIVARHDFPAPVRDCLGQLCAAGLLLSASLKFDGTLVLQIHGDGPVALLVVECEADGRFRATAKLREGHACPDDADLPSLVNANGQGRFVVTLDPGTRSPNRQPYQGIVPFEGNTVGEVLERYMARSEQVPTRLWIAADGSRAVGLLLQRLPDEGGKAIPGGTAVDPDGWNRMQQLAETVTRDELLGLEPDRVLHRLFWQETLHGFESREPRFACSCSRDKVEAMLRMLGREEVESIVSERGSVSVRCEFCNAPYEFDAVDSARLFLSGPQAPGSAARH
jgi:molecular chaperone Hsp33